MCSISAEKQWSWLDIDRVAKLFELDRKEAEEVLSAADGDIHRLQMIKNEIVAGTIEDNILRYILYRLNGSQPAVDEDTDASAIEMEDVIGSSDYDALVLERVLQRI